MDNLDLEEESEKLWAEYHAARAANAGFYDYGALASRVRSLCSRAKKRGFNLIAQRLGDLSSYIARAKKEQSTPEEQLRAFWPALVPSVIEAAILEAERALQTGTPAKLRKSQSALRCTDEPEHLAEIAEEGLAEDFAKHIPGAVVDSGMLILSPGHEALIERGRRVLGQLRVALASGRARR